MTLYYESELYHHGIKGMKWGVRRFQYKDGSLTAAGEKRYSTDVEKAKSDLVTAKVRQKKANAEYNNKTLGGLIPNKEAAQNLLKAKGNVGLAKERLKNEKAKERLNNETKEKSKHRLALEEKYRSQGMSKEEAEVAAYRRARAEKIVAATAAVAITAAAVYVAKNQYDKRVDKIIKAGTDLQNISTNANKDFSRAFYSSKTRLDNAKYQGMYGGMQLGGLNGKDIFKTKLSTTSDVKVASENSAVKALSSLVNENSSYKNVLEKHLSDVSGRMAGDKSNKVIAKGLESLKSGKVDKNVYNALNVSLTAHQTQNADAVSKGFYNKLTSMGYDAIMDVNDKKYSGYKSSSPLIVFNGAKAKVESVTKLGKQEMNRAANIGGLDITLKNAAPLAAAGAAFLGVTRASSNASTRSAQNKVIQNYRKEHPGTKLSYDEILDNYYNT